MGECPLRSSTTRIGVSPLELRFRRESRAVDQADVTISGRCDLFFDDQAMPVVTVRPVIRSRVMKSDHSADFEKSRPAVVGISDSGTGLVAVKKQQIDRDRPVTRHLF